MVLPFSTHHACISRDGSRCLVLDVPTENWMVQSLGEHADASRRLLDQPARLALMPGNTSWCSGWHKARCTTR